MKFVLIVLAALVVLCSCQPPQISTPEQVQNDLKTLNYALTLEHLEAAFYTQGLAIYNDATFSAAGFEGTRPYFNLIRAHEQSHVALLTAVISGAGGTPVQACTYNFRAAFSSVQNFIATARVLEITGAMAYDGAANTINDATYLQVAATIATVEARHSAWLNTLNGLTPFNSSFEATLTPAQVVAAAAGFFVSCPQNITLPVFAYEYVPLANFSLTYYNVSGQPETQAQIDNDNDVLNYALTLELFGHAFYGLVSRFTQADFTAANLTDVYPYFQMIIAHENAHVDFLQSTLVARGALTAAPCTYLGLDGVTDTVAHAVQFAKTLENLEVTAYDGAINDFTDHQLIQGAATIATVEARHAEYLLNRLDGIPVNNESLDEANSPAQILNLTAAFFGSDCTKPVVPVKAYTLQAQNLPPTPSASTAPSASSAPSPVPSSAPSTAPSTNPSTVPTPTPTATPTTCPGTPTPTPTCGTPTPSPSNCYGSNDDDDGVKINFYFADMLRGL